MHIAILTFDGFNELDSLIALGILNRIKEPGWRVSIASPTVQVTSLNGVVIESHISLTEAAQADAVLVGSGMKTRDVVANDAIMAQLQLDPTRQLIGAQCSGALILAKLGLLDAVPACTDLTTRPWLEETGVEVLEQALYVRGNIATSGGCLASSYLAAWLIARVRGLEAAQQAIHYVAPIGEKEDYIRRIAGHIEPYLPAR